MLIPTVIETDGLGERAYDIYSRLLKDRIIFVGDEIEPHTANLIIAQILFLENDDPKRTSSCISIVRVVLSTTPWQFMTP